MNFTPSKPQAIFMANLKQLPSSISTPWSVATEQMYLTGFHDVPDADLPALCQSVLERCKFRPTVCEIKELWREMTSPAYNPPQYRYDPQRNVFVPIPSASVQQYLSGDPDN